LLCNRSSNGKGGLDGIIIMPKENVRLYLAIQRQGNLLYIMPQVPDQCKRKAKGGLVVSWLGLMKALIVLALLIVLVWFIYVSQICMGIFFVMIGIWGLLWAKDYMESQFSPERA
jgi:hypothetical protein